MSSSDGFDGAHFHRHGPSGGSPGQSLETLLFESLCYMLLEKGVLTKNDALSVVQTVAEVVRGTAEAREASGHPASDLIMLRRMFTSFESLADRPGDVDFSAGNVHRLRPPLHGDEPQFPDND